VFRKSLISISHPILRLGRKVTSEKQFQAVAFPIAVSHQTLGREEHVDRSTVLCCPWRCYTRK
jgi:hypothetical protein